MIATLIKKKALKKIVLLMLSLLGIVRTYSQTRVTASGKLHPFKSGSTIKIDGLLNEAVWKKSFYTDKFYNKEDSIHAFGNTKAYFTYDNQNLYIAYQCIVKDTSLLPRTKLPKGDESIKDNEWVAVCLDTYNDGVVAYAFFADAAGNQLEGLLNEKNELNYSFSTRWTSAVKNISNGYTVEMKIPLTKLPVRWQKQDAEIAVRLVRFDKQNNQEVQQPFLDKSIHNQLAQFQKVVLKNISPTHPNNLSGVDLSKRLLYKKSRIKMNTLKGRSLGGDASVMDYALFKKRLINGAVHPRIFVHSQENGLVNACFEKTDYMKSRPKQYGFETFLEREQTSAFLVISNDTIVYEKYFNGFDRNSVFTSFSVAKSFVSTLVGIAISEGYIKSGMDKITTYIPELLKKDARFADISIRDLLSMSSGLTYSEDDDPSDDDITYNHPDLRKAVMEFARIEKRPGEQWLYNNYNPLLLGIILERTTHKTVSKYMEEKLWKKMGGGKASWSLDENGFEKMESGINCGIYDYARFAEIFLNNGRYGNEQIVPQSWVEKASQPQVRASGYYDDLLDHNLYYSYFWWGKYRGSSAYDNDFFGLGNKGEYIYICPQKKIIIIRLGFEYGLPTPASFSWPDLFYQFASNFK